MIYMEEIIARALYEQLLLLPFPPNTSIVPEGAGVHWHCKITAGKRVCTIHCFDSLPAEYYADYDINGICISTSRTRQQKETLEIALQWINGASIENLYPQYECIDFDKRRILFAHQSLTNQNKALLHCHLLFTERPGYECWHYLLQREDRAIEYDTQDTPSTEFGFHFLWGQERMFSFRSTSMELIEPIISHWLLHKSTPTVLKALFPDLSIKQIAFEYEKGCFTAGDFYECWEVAEQIYQLDHYAAWVKLFVSSLRQKGYDRKLHAHTSVGRLVLNRKRHLWYDYEEQPCLILVFRDTFIEAFEGEEQKKQDIHTTTVTEEVTRLLDALCEQPVNYTDTLIPLDITIRQ